MTDTPSLRVVWAVADAVGTDPVGLPPLNDVIDTDALDALFDERSNHADRGDSDYELQFSYAGRQVHVSADRVRVEAAPRTTPAMD